MKTKLVFWIFEVIVFASMGFACWSDSVPHLNGYSLTFGEMFRVVASAFVVAVIVGAIVLAIWKTGKYLVNGYRLNPKYAAYLPLVRKESV